MENRSNILLSIIFISGDAEKKTLLIVSISKAQIILPTNFLFLDILKLKIGLTALILWEIA